MNVSIENIKLRNNYVLCELTEKNNEHRTKSGIFLMSEGLNKDQFKFNNLNRVMDVIKVPDKLDYVPIKGNPRNFTRWGTEMEVLPGDKVFISATEADSALSLDIDGKQYFMINYFEIRAAKRGEEVIPVNGYILCEEIFEEKKVLSFSVKKNNKTKARVLHVGKQNSYYVQGKDKKSLECGTEIKEGDIIIKDPLKHVMLEGDKFLRFGDKPIIVIQKRYIDAIVA